MNGHGRALAVSIVIGALVALLATALLAPLGLGLNNAWAENSAPACSDASLQGAYAGSASGYILTGSDGMPLATPTPFAAVERFTFDGAGGGTADLTENAGGKVVHPSGAIIYSVNADCTGTFALQLGMTRTEDWSLVVEDAGRSLLVATDNHRFAITINASLLPLAAAAMAVWQEPMAEWRAGT